MVANLELLTANSNQFTVVAGPKVSRGSAVCYPMHMLPNACRNPPLEEDSILFMEQQLYDNYACFYGTIDFGETIQVKPLAGGY